MKCIYWVSLFLLLATGPSAIADPVATVEMVDGTVFVTRITGKRRILAHGSSLEAGDTVSTERDSYTKLRFIDGGEVAIRPLSILVIQRYQFDKQQPEQDNAFFRLVKGGLRTITGLIGKRGDQNAYRLDGATATIGIRGTEFIARVCNNDCNPPTSAEAQKKGIPINSSPVSVVARLSESNGQTYVTPTNSVRQSLAIGAPLYAGNKIDVDPRGFAVLIFNDQTRLVLNGGSQYVLTDVRYNLKQPEQGNMVTNLFKGGIRMLTGLLGKIRPEKIEIQTVVATIGVRGTNFDIVCAATGSQARGDDPITSGPVTCDQALYAQTRDGTIEITSGPHHLTVRKGETGYIDTPGGVPALLAQAPAFLRDNPSPKPEDIDVNMDKLFGPTGSDQNQSGLYAEVKEGRISLSQPNAQTLIINAGEVGFAGAGGEDLYKLNGAPNFVDEDVWLKNMRIDPAACRAQ